MKTFKDFIYEKINEDTLSYRGLVFYNTSTNGF